MHGIVDEWKRIFPKVRVLPCPTDSDYLDVFSDDDINSDDDMSEDSDDMNGDSDDDMTDVSDELVEDSDGDTTEDSESHTTERRRSTIITTLGRSLPNDPRFEFNDVGSDWFKFRVALWRSLGYSGGYRIKKQFDNMWQTNMEIKIIGWPVVPLKAFCESEPYSTSAHGSC
jgi:hypothetical protein